jgi:hypothetical protein
MKPISLQSYINTVKEFHFNKYNASIQPFFNYSILSAPLFPNWFDKLKWFLAKIDVNINMKFLFFFTKNNVIHILI